MCGRISVSSPTVSKSVDEQLETLYRRRSLLDAAIRSLEVYRQSDGVKPVPARAIRFRRLLAS